MNEELTRWVGRSVMREDLVTDRLLSEYRAALDPFLFVAPEADNCPPGLHWGLAPAIPPMTGLGSDGAEALGIFLPPIAMKHRMWAGGEVETYAPISRGMAITRVSTVASVEMREGKSGPLCFVSVNHELKSDDRLMLRERQDLVFKDRTGGFRPQGAPVIPKGSIEWRVAATPVWLFRFSAFTFNAHRIHYDLSHAVNEEGYAGLLVHGPLQAALLFNQAAVALGYVPERFAYRCIAPLITGPDMTVATATAQAGTSGWITDAGGAVTCEARSSARAPETGGA